MTLVILQWNANGLRAHLGELRQFIATADTKPHIICIQETFLKPDHRVELGGYNTERRDRPGHKGGVATLISSTLSYTVIPSTRNNLEELSVSITTSAGSRTITNVYNPSGHAINADDYSELFDRRNIVIVGDFNSHSALWGSPTTDRNGDVIETLLHTHGLVTLNTGEGTFIKPQGGCTHLDLTLVSSHLAARSSWNVIHDSLGSDHLPILTTIDERPVLEDLSHKRWVLRRADWPAFTEACRGMNTGDNTADNELVYTKLVAGIVSAADKAIPKASGRSRFKPVPYWTDACSRAVENRNHARNRMNRTRLLDDCIKYRRLKAVAQRTLKDASKEHWHTYCDSLTSSTKLGSVWKMARKMTGTSSQQSMPNLVKDGTSYGTNADKANLLAATYAEASSNRNCSSDFIATKQRLLEEWRKTRAPETSDAKPCSLQENTSSNLNEPFTRQELREAIDGSKNNTAPGSDGITYEMVRHLPECLFDHLLLLYNGLFAQGRVLTAWKESVVIPIPKAGADRSKPESYRPIALTAVLCKLFERLIVNRLQWYMEINKLLNPLQSGFRKERSTIDHITRLQDDIHKSLANGEHTLALFLDFSKAFDMVWRDGLMHKLRQLGVKGNMHSCISDFLCDRRIQVRVGSSLSARHEMENGTPQGSILSPLLFNVMINDIPTPSDVATKSAIFADDNSAWKSGRNVTHLNQAMQRHVDNVADWSSRWGFKLSEKKSTAVLFTRSTRPAITAEVTLKINGVAVPVEKEAKFLGVIFDSRLSWKAHISHVVTKCKRAVNLLRCVSGHSWGASKASMLCIYRSLVRSRLDYGCEAFYMASSTQLQRLDTLQRQCLQLCCGTFCLTATNALQQDCGEPPLWIRRQRYLLRYAAKVTANPTNPANSILCNHWKTERGKYEETKEPVFRVIQPYLSQRHTDVQVRSLPTTPRWHTLPPRTDDSLSHSVKKSEDVPIVMRALALELVEKYSDTLRVYTDGSKEPDGGRVAAAFYVEEIEFGHAVRLNDGLSVYAAELTAVLTAINWLLTTGVQAGRSITVFTDSLSTLKALQSRHSPSRSTQLATVLDAICQLQQPVTFVWVPSHVGVPGNEAADALAKAGLNRPIVDVQTPWELGEELDSINTFTLATWQRWYNEQTAGAFYREVEPRVSTKVKYTHKRRAQEVMVTRLRLGKCRLNHYLHQIDRHPDGHCAACGTPETVAHIILHCSNNDLKNQLLTRCQLLNIQPTLRNILREKPLTDLIYHLLLRTGRPL